MTFTPTDGGEQLEFPFPARTVEERRAALEESFLAGLYDDFVQDSKRAWWLTNTNQRAGGMPDERQQL